MNAPKIRIYNTLSRTKELFRPIRKGRVGLYTCGPTVYNYAHIGNLRTYIFEDILRRTLEHAGFNVTHVMNITDVGHLTSDADEGDDKLEKGAKREGKTVWEIAAFYTKAFLKDIEALHIKKAHTIIPATRTIQKQIILIKALFTNGYAYETSQAIYFDVSKFKNYTRLSRQKLGEKIAGARREVVGDSEKRNPQDFALWFKRVGKFSRHTMHWNSPWGDGFPGWHIECSAISTFALGQPFDIHTGGVDHITVHHTNEIAQSEAAFKKPLANYWMHGEFLVIDDTKMAKSEENFLTLPTLTEKGFSPLAYRYLVLTSHYRSKLNFTWESLAGAKHSLERLYECIRVLLEKRRKSKKTRSLRAYQHVFERALADDLDTPKALAVIWKLIAEYNARPDSFDAHEIRRLLYDFDAVLGLGFKSIKQEKIPERIRLLAEKREAYRKSKNWALADKIRGDINSAGFALLDTPEGVRIQKKHA